MPYANAGDVKLYYESTGEGTPLILHGHGHLNWMIFQVPYFSQFYRVIVFDRRGTGRSDDPPGPWTPADFARDLRGLMDDLGIEQAIVGGNSLGGVISSQFGLDYPDRALALIVGHTAPYRRPLSRQWLEEQIERAERGEPVIVRQPRSFEWEDEGPPTIAEGFETTQVGRYLATLNRDLGNKEAIIKMLRALADWDQRPRYPELQQLDVPTLVIVGGNEPQKTIELSYEWHQQFKNSEFLILPNTHHAAAVENPIGWNKAVHGFLARHNV
ncbi:MAG: alpha/beta hydrolase [Chloroflexota bacterium]|nr:alpha/beta hydrolase [Chloroflexota bacterium]